MGKLNPESNNNPLIQFSAGSGRIFSEWRRWFFVLCCVVASYWAGSRFHWPSFQKAAGTINSVDIPDHVFPCKPGVWGNLEYIPIYIEPPEEFLPVSEIEYKPLIWKFNGYTVESLKSLLHATDLSSEQKSELIDSCKTLPDNAGITVTPSRQLVLSMSGNTRKLIYGVLVQWVGNPTDYRAFFPADKFDDYFSESRLPAGIIKMVRQLSFQRGRLLFFCDAQLVLSELKSSEQKVRFIKTIYRKSTLLLQLHVTPKSDINSLENYWSKAAWGKDIRPMLDSLKRVPGGARVSIVHLMPPQPGGDLYTFPFPSLRPYDLRKDCHWTAFNFFRDPPDPRFGGDDAEKNKVITQTLENDYYPVLHDPRYGDLVELVRPNGLLVHSSVFIGDDIVYTKNSAQFLEPFMLMTIEDMKTAISTTIPDGESLRVAIFRSKYY